MFYSKCKKCGRARRWLSKEESLDPSVVERERNRPLSEAEIKNADKKNMIIVHCSACYPKGKEKK
jgi:hypothetical protein